MLKKPKSEPQSEASKILRRGFQKIADKVNYDPKKDLMIQRLKKDIAEIMRQPEPGLLCRIFCPRYRR